MFCTDGVVVGFSGCVQEMSKDDMEIGLLLQLDFLVL